MGGALGMLEEVTRVVREPAEATIDHAVAQPTLGAGFLATAAAKPGARALRSLGAGPSLTFAEVTTLSPFGAWDMAEALTTFREKRAPRFSDR